MQAICRRAYYRIRKLQPDALTQAQRAARFLYLNRFCFNGLFRTNQSGGFNVPYGGRRSGSLPELRFLQACSEALKKTTVVCTSFDNALDQVKSGDFVYLDPPYAINARRVFNEYSHSVFDDTQLKILRSHLERLDKIGIPFLVSYGYSAEALELGKGFRCKHAFVQRQIAGFVDSRKRARELLIKNF